MSDSNPEETFSYVAEQLNQFGLAYLHIVDALEGDIRHGARVVQLSILRQSYQGVLIVCGGYDKKRGNTVIAEGMADAVAFAQLFLSNPDLPKRFKRNGPYNEPDMSTFYGGGEKGYIDYSFLQLEG
jgi:N-ethylmaleimide reductase